MSITIKKGDVSDLCLEQIKIHLKDAFENGLKMSDLKYELNELGTANGFVGFLIRIEGNIDSINDIKRMCFGSIICHSEPEKDWISQILKFREDNKVPSMGNYAPYYGLKNAISEHYPDVNVGTTYYTPPDITEKMENYNDGMNVVFYNMLFVLEEEYITDGSESAIHFRYSM